MLNRLNILIFSLLGSLWLSGCGSDVTPERPIPEGLRRYLEDFVLLDEASNVGPARVPGLAITPFGTLIQATASGTARGFCSTTHVRFGVLLASAHCLAGDIDPNNLYVVYYDKSGNKRFARVQSGGYYYTSYAGYQPIHDILIMRIAAARASEWDSLEGNVSPRAIPPAAEAPIAVTFWAYDPLHTTHLALHAIHGDGMKFRRGNCQAKRVRPRLEGYVTEMGMEKRTEIRLGVDPRYHLTLDECSVHTVSGNSGGWVSERASPRTGLGLVLGSVSLTASQRDAYEGFFYVGVNGVERRRAKADFPSNRILSVAYAFALSLDDYLAGKPVSIVRPGP